MIQEQLSVIEALERVLQKRPKFSHFPASEGLWRHAILGENNREEDMEMLMKHQHDRLESILIREGLYAAMESGEDMQRLCVLSEDDEQAMRIVFVGSKCVPLSFDTMGSLIWNNKCMQPTGATVIESIHPNLVHIREDIKLPDPTMPTLEAHFVCRRYVEANRIVIVWRSIVEDQLLPHEKGHLISNREGWSVITAKGTNECFTQIYISTATPIFPPALHSIQPAVGTLTELLLKATTENKMNSKSVLFGSVKQQQQQLTSDSCE
ncbi:hypothetical protein THRCLA_21716 [Thraustotheca clavata]|uniref:START domain-containing protein n=1 Tax=Thraustotheca clavata TaxID=74557 RepID=A0A1V9ZQH3_9STRA|nr:hypothetical protein THRCLA_21716 [Thraustotheca clavata]